LGSNAAGLVCALVTCCCDCTVLVPWFTTGCNLSCTGQGKFSAVLASFCHVTLLLWLIHSYCGFSDYCMVIIVLMLFVWFCNTNFTHFQAQTMALFRLWCTQVTYPSLFSTHGLSSMVSDIGFSLFCSVGQFYHWDTILGLSTNPQVTTDTPNDCNSSFQLFICSIVSICH